MGLLVYIYSHVGLMVACFKFIIMNIVIFIAMLQPVCLITASTYHTTKRPKGFLEGIHESLNAVKSTKSSKSQNRKSFSKEILL